MLRNSVSCPFGELMFYSLMPVVMVMNQRFIGGNRHQKKNAGAVGV